MPPSAREWKHRQGSGLSPICNNPAIFGSSVHAHRQRNKQSGIHMQARERIQDAISDAASLTQSERETETETVGGGRQRRRPGSGEQVEMT